MYTLDSFGVFKYGEHFTDTQYLMVSVQCKADSIMFCKNLNLMYIFRYVTFQYLNYT